MDKLRPDDLLPADAALATTCDVAVVGAGPAGMAAATLAADLGLDVVLLDENNEAGGTMYRGIANLPSEVQAKLMPARAQHAALETELARSGARHKAGTAIHGIAAAANGFELCVSVAGVASMARARAVILATGAVERSMPIAGGTLPGVIGAGHEHARLALGGAVPEGCIVLAGCGPLLYLVANELQVAGATVVAVLDILHAARFVRALPYAIDFMRSPYYARGAALISDINDSIPVHHDVIELAALGNDKVVSVRFTTNRRTRTLIADHLLLHQGMVPDVQLAGVAGCALCWDERSACWMPTVDAWGASSVARLFIAGDGAAIAGATAAVHRGRLAALAAATTLGRIDVAARDAAARTHRSALAKSLRGRRFLDTLYRPPDRFRLAEGDTVVCHCEKVTARQVIDAVRAGAAGPDQLKAYLRCGMGTCQGRDCGLTVTELVARERRMHPAAVGGFRPRFPVRPLTLGALAGLPRTTAEEQAVLRLPEVDPPG
ncbi:MAG: (2Fe-2S)-binding protein [Casimicrobiaceae bacterium]